MAKPFGTLSEELLTKDSRDDCRIFEPWTPARNAFAQAFFGEPEPHLNEMWGVSESLEALP